MSKVLINEPRLNLACGQIRIDGYFGIDYVKTEATDAVMDLETFPWDIESESAEDIFCSHYVEHIPHDTISKVLLKIMKQAKTFKEQRDLILSLPENLPSDGFIKFMDEVYRILIPGGKIKIIAPYYNSIRAWQDPTHQRAISEATFLYFNKGWRDANKLDHYGIHSDSDFTYGYDMEAETASKEESARNFRIKYYTNVINDIHMILTKRVIEK